MMVIVTTLRLPCSRLGAMLNIYFPANVYNESAQCSVQYLPALGARTKMRQVKYLFRI